jgi:ribosomal protein S1
VKHFYGQISMILSLNMEALQLQDFHVGDIVSGIIKCIENFGILLSIVVW